MSIDELRQGAAAGDPDAMYNLGLLLCRGVGVPQDCSEGAYWLERAAQLGDVEAMFCAGGAYAGAFDDRDPLDLSRAAYWTLAAAALGHVQAYERAGFCLETGAAGVARDLPGAVQYYVTAARSGSRPAADHLRRLGVSWTHLKRRGGLLPAAVPR